MKQEFTQIAEDYQQERESCSINHFVLDPYLQQFMQRLPKGKCLDYGAGIGTVSRTAKTMGFAVTAYEPDPAMFAKMEKRLEGMDIALIKHDSDILGSYSLILSLNMLDYVDDIGEMFRHYYQLLDDGGFLIVSVPHPLKDLGDWEKRQQADSWVYLYYRLDNYLCECVCEKKREDAQGNVIESRVKSYHRTMSTYYNALVDAGFSVLEMQEPGPVSEAEAYPAIYEKTSRIPYFLVFLCRKEICHEKR